MDRQRLEEAINRPAPVPIGSPRLASIRPKFKIHLYDTLPSTNQQAWWLVDQGAGAGTVVIASQQTAGRGQWGRRWQSASGGLYLSLVLEPDVAIAETALLTLASAWGIAIGLENHRVPVQIKWPNDLVYQGCKLGGILTESRVRNYEASALLPHPPGGMIHTAVVGVGINWDNQSPAGAISLRQILSSLPDGCVNSLEELGAIVLRGIVQGYLYWTSHGADTFVKAYQRLLCHKGKTVMVDGQTATVTGISSSGNLTVTLGCEKQGITRCLKPGEIRLGYNG